MQDQPQLLIPFSSKRTLIVLSIAGFSLLLSRRDHMILYFAIFIFHRASTEVDLISEHPQ